jgi:hypothetical protein
MYRPSSKMTAVAGGAPPQRVEGGQLQDLPVLTRPAGLLIQKTPQSVFKVPVGRLEVPKGADYWEKRVASL